MPIRTNISYLFYDPETGNRFLDLKSIETATPKKSEVLNLYGDPISYDGHEMVLANEEKFYPDWRVKIYTLDDEAPAMGSSGTIKIDILGSDSISGGELSSPETLWTSGSLTALGAGQNMFDAILPMSMRRRYIQIQITVGTAKMTAGRLYAEAYATNYGI